MATQPQAASTVCQDPVLSRFSQPPNRPPSVLHGSAPFVLEESRIPSWLQFTRKISEKFQQNHSILAYMNCKEFPMKFPRGLKKKHNFDVNHISCPTVEMGGFSGGQGGHVEKIETLGQPSAGHGNVSLHHHEGRSPSWRLRSEEVDFSRIKKYGRSQSRANNASFRLKKEEPLYAGMPFKTLMLRIH